MKTKFLKILKFLSSRFIYLAIGIFLAIGVTYVYATWDQAKTINNADPDQLTRDNWNEMVNMMQAMDGKVTTMDAKIDAVGGDCYRTVATRQGSQMCGEIAPACNIGYTTVYKNSYVMYVSATIETTFCERWCCK
jgi:hypothetical protein